MTRPFRTELKFVIRHEQRSLLLERWRRHLTKDPHTNEAAVTPVLSQYYDTPSLGFYEEKLDGLWFRNKVRLRTYSYRFKPGCTAFLEIKQRLADRVRKIRHKVTCFEPSLLEPRSWTFDQPEQRSAFGVLLERYQLQPSAQVWYLREAYESLVEPVRVTFDSCLTALHAGAELTWETLADPTLKFMPENRVICEIKATEILPRWVFSGVKAAELVQRPVPKYVLAMERLRLPGRPPVHAVV